MHPDVAALLDVQTDDLAIHKLEGDIAQLMPRVNALAAECSRAKAALEQAQSQVEAERKRRREVEMRIAEHRSLHDKHQAVLNSVTSQREATAATAQLDQVSKIIAEEQRDVGAIGQRISELEALVADREMTLASAEEAKREAEASISGEREKFQGEIDQLRTRRDDRAKSVSRALLSTYDRIRSKRHVHALHPLRGNSCGQCDTAVPLQRRTQMVMSGKPEMCEGCGVLLYAHD